MADQGITFDSAPVKQDMPVGMTFDSAPVKQDTAVDSSPATDSQPLSDQDIFQRDTDYKTRVYSQAHSDFKAGNYRKAASDLLGLVTNPDELNPQDIPIGMVKGAGQSANFVSEGISKVAPSIVRPSDVPGL